MAVLGLLSPHQLLFGMDYAEIAQRVAQLGLRLPITDIENFWLLMFLHVGVVGYGLFLVGFAALLVGQWRSAPFAGRLMLLAVLLVASTSNSLGRKSAILTVLIPSVLAAGARQRTLEASPAPIAQDAVPLEIPGQAVLVRSLRPAPLARSWHHTL